MGNCVSGAGGGVSQSGSDFVSFAPNRGNAIADRLNDAAELKLARNTITIKDDEGKTRGIIRDIRRMDMKELSPREVFDYRALLRSKGVESEVRDTLRDSGTMYEKDNNLYFVYNGSREQFVRDYGRNSDQAVTKNYDNEIKALKKLQAQGVNIVKMKR